MFDFVTARTNMVDSQLRPHGITDSRILQAMQDVNRESFVPEEQRSIAYMDGDVPLRGAATLRFLMEPMAFAKMLQLANVGAHDRVLEIGAATGYGAKVLSHLAGHVVAVECDATLVLAAQANLSGLGNVTVVEHALAEGYAKGGPYAVIIVSGAVEIVPETLFSQLSEGGRLVAGFTRGGVTTCSIWQKTGLNHTRRSAFEVSIAALPGFGRPSIGFAF